MFIAMLQKNNPCKALYLQGFFILTVGLQGLEP